MAKIDALSGRKLSEIRRYESNSLNSDMGYAAGSVPSYLTAVQVERILRNHCHTWASAIEEGFEQDVPRRPDGTYSARKLSAWLGY